jgi:hypothetical protein
MRILYARRAVVTGKPPARSTVHQEIVLLRQVLKTAQRHTWLAAVPDLSMPYKTSSYGLGDVHNAIAVLQLAADYLKQTEADVTRDE